MSRLLSITLLFLALVTGCGRKPGASGPDLSAYTNIPPGTPITLMYRVKVINGNAPRELRDATAFGIPVQGVLVSITPDEVAIQQSATGTQVNHYGKETVNFIRTNAP